MSNYPNQLLKMIKMKIYENMICSWLMPRYMTSFLTFSIPNKPILGFAVSTEWVNGELFKVVYYVTICNEGEGWYFGGWE